LRSGKHAVGFRRLEGVHEMLDDWLPGAWRPGDGDDVEPRAVLEQVVPLEIGEGQARQPAAFAQVDGIGGMPFA
jgi:hypothetical protein